MSDTEGGTKTGAWGLFLSLLCIPLAVFFPPLWAIVWLVICLLIIVIGGTIEERWKASQR